ncbi:YggT family protein [Chloroflexus sp.]|uniref:YggT family protein n=1 Tax=Chloroflexus sp. TaxID=1904827 RepID=UPI00262B031F|nr:YggT family protein [uncultured Chloroflexus sp.]
MQINMTGMLREGIALLGGALCGLLVARLVLKVLAARPDSPAVMWLYSLTEPLVMPLAMIDRDQPRFGAVLELSTLATLIVLLSLTALAWAWLGRKNLA